MNRVKQIEERLAQIGEELKRDGADLDALEKEIGELKAERKTFEDAAEKRAALVAEALESGRMIRSFPNPDATTREQTFGADSPEYRSAWLKSMAHNEKTGEWRLGELSDVEKRAFSYTTATTPNAVPTGISLGIVDMIAKQYALMGDLNITQIAGVVEFLQATTIVAGAAASTAENVANANDLQITFEKVTMSGIEIKGSVKIGAKMRLQSIDGFEDYLVSELSREMGQAMNEHVFASIDTDMLSGNKFATTAGVALTAADIREAFGALKGARGQRVVYANGATIWNHIAGVTDETGKEKFIESSVTDDPAVQGRIYGTIVKLDDTLADNVIRVGYPATVKANMFDAPSVMSDINVTTREVTHGGFALFEAALGDTRSWAKITVTPAA